MGAGTMGCVNALVAAVAGYDCVVYDTSENALASAPQRLVESAPLYAAAGLLDPAVTRQERFAALHFNPGSKLVDVAGPFGMLDFVGLDVAYDGSRMNGEFVGDKKDMVRIYLDVLQPYVDRGDLFQY